MSAINKKVSLPLVATFLGTAIGALSGEFVWALLTGLGAWVSVILAQDLFVFARRTDAGGQTVTDAGDGVSQSLQTRPIWLEQWIEDMDHCPSYKGTPGNIWNDPKWTSRD